MLLYTKLYVLGIIVFTTLASLWIDKKVPYFPIEISRIAGPHGTVSNGIFKYGILSLPLFMLLSRDQVSLSSGNWAALLLGWTGLVMLGFFDDTNHWYQRLSLLFVRTGYANKPQRYAHMAGVTVLGISAAGYCVLNFTMGKAMLLVCAGFLWALRVLVKGFVVFAFEIPQDDWRFSVVEERFHAIMQQGGPACSYPLVTLTAFKIAGVGQWIVFFILSFLV